MKIQANGIDIHYEIEGNGPWLTMSHSLACNLHMWNPQMPVLTKKFKVLRYDTRGHGQSSAPAGDYTLEQLADTTSRRPPDAAKMWGERIQNAQQKGPEAARAIHQNLKGSELKIISSAAHLSNIEQAQVFNEAMIGFLDRAAKRN